MKELPLKTIQSRRFVYGDHKVLIIDLKEMEGAVRFITLTTAMVIDGKDVAEKQFTIPAQISEEVAETIEALGNWPSSSAR